MRESAVVRRSVATMLAAWRVPLPVVLGLGASGTPFRTRAIESAELGRKQEARPLPRWLHSAAVVNGKIHAVGGATIGVDKRSRSMGSSMQSAAGGSTGQRADGSPFCAHVCPRGVLRLESKPVRWKAGEPTRVYAVDL